jgi:hypothetical protein
MPASDVAGPPRELQLPVFFHTLIDGSGQKWEISLNVEAHSYRLLLLCPE